MNDEKKHEPLNNSQNKKDPLAINNETFNPKDFFATEFMKSAAQTPLLNHICVDIVEENMQWVSERRAQTMFYKSPDLIVFEREQINWKATRKLHEIQRERNLKDEIYFATEKALCYNDLCINNSHAIWTIDVDVDGKPYTTLVDRNNILQIGIDKISNNAVECKIRKEVFQDISGVYWYLIETRNIDYIETSIATWNNGKLSFLSDKNLPNDVTKNFDATIGKNEWKFNVVPFVYIKNTSKAFGDIKFIKSYLYKDILLRGQEYIETLVSGTKIVTDESSNQNMHKYDKNKKTDGQILETATKPVIRRSRSLLPNGTANPQIAYGQPTLDVYDRARKSNKNEMLQKIGAATDVDSKGTVQQSQSELLQTRGDEYKVIEWKNSHRQEKILELMDKFAKILQVQSESNDEYKEFKNYDRVQVLLAKNEVISENDLIENLQKAKEHGLIDEIIAVARFNKINLWEARELINTRKLVKNV